MKVALVHELLTQFGGAERVLQAFHEIYPEAPVYTLVYDRERTFRLFDGWDIRTSFLQRLPGMPRVYKWYLPLMPSATEAFDLSPYELVLSDASAFAKGVITKRPTRHICYCHTPTRYLWQDMDSYVASMRYPSVVKLLAKRYLKSVLRPWDVRAAQRPDFFIANSRTVKERIKKYYDRDADVIPPPVDTKFFAPIRHKKDFYFTASRLEPYKKIELVIEAFNQLDLPLKVAGTGTTFASLQARANPSVEFLGRVSDEELRILYGEAKAFVFPAVEDAGIMVLESLACGTPVIGLAQGGTAEFITDGENGALFGEQTVSGLVAAVERFEKMRFEPGRLRRFVQAYDKAAFQKNILAYVQERFKTL